MTRRGGWCHGVGVVVAAVVLTLNAPAGAWAVERPDSTWGLDRISHETLDKPYTYAYDESAGEGVTVYVVATGIRTTHAEFQTESGSRATWGFNAVDAQDSDCNGAGTHLAATVAGKTHGVANKARVVAVKAAGCGGTAAPATLVKAMNWVARTAVRNHSVVLLGLGGRRNPAVDAAVDTLHDAGITVVAPAGDESQDTKNVSPGRAPNAITVGAVDVNNTIAGFSNWGPGVDVFAPGVQVASAWTGDDGKTKSIDGTGSAAAHVAGLAAYFIARSGGSTPADAADKITNYALKDKVGGKIRTSPNRIAYNAYK
ncbi:hypothetical protein B4N89_46585 [Embleya scabrispora]|uniref:Peptidase S8/S53 domain-containing protein n=1 Tax=Embleya scabrispora TaxID=159449 RepID=A0A1T3NI87_9ACTN|nr:S8 family peptidase [Embleya scabrispora]OPC76498.1 hypothetical protein B4N89_46585 [Embleya scabrispora]